MGLSSEAQFFGGVGIGMVVAGNLPLQLFGVGVALLAYAFGRRRARAAGIPVKEVG